jgi:spore coat polysaccharide biosynthesis predicted glycosyltransferase SpsG/RimJ/RimL family protein N-acetyltransferase
MPPTLVLRPESGAGVGIGHLMRSLATAEAWVAAGGRAVLAVVDAPSAVRSGAESSGIELVQLSPTGDEFPDLLDGVDPGWVLFDGYGFAAGDHRAARRPGRVVAAVDDFGRVASFDVDLVIDANLGATPDPYLDAAPGAMVLLGPRFVRLRRRFLELGRRDLSAATASAGAPQILVPLGGAPPAAARRIAEQALERAGLGDRAVSLLDGPPVEDVALLMRDADLALTAAGTTVWELCYLGVPMVAFPIVDNQEPVAQALADAGVALALPASPTAEEVRAALVRLRDDIALRRRLGERGAALVDGGGGRRVTVLLKALGVRLRRAEAADARLVLDWSNDPATRAASFTSDEITWDDHLAWISERLSHPDHVILHPSDVDGPLGMFRAARAGDGAVVGVVIAPGRRRSGWSGPLILAASRWIRRHGWSVRLDAEIRQDNLASQRAFAAAGYALVDRSEDADRVHYALEGPWSDVRW